MSLLPYKKLTYNTHLTHAEIRECIEQNTLLDKSEMKKGELFIGKVKGMGYLIKNNIYYQNSFLPVCHIIFKEAGALNNSRLTVTYRMNYKVLAFMVVFLMYFLMAAIGSLVNGNDFYGIFPTLIVLVSFLIMSWGFNKELKISESRLTKLLSLTPDIN